MSAEGIRLGPPPWLGQLQGLSFCGGRGRGRARGEAGGQRLRGAGCGEGSTSGFLQCHCSPWKAFPASVKCGPLALCLAWPWRGPVRPTTGPVPTFRHFREKQTTASASWMASTPLACLDRPTEGAQGTPADSLFPWTHAYTCAREMRFQLPWLLSPLASQKEQEINIQIHLSSEWSFAAKKNVTQTLLQDLEVKAPGEPLRGNAQPSSRSALTARGAKLTRTFFFFLRQKPFGHRSLRH